MQTVAVQSIACSLVDTLAARPFEGRIFGLFARACNLTDPAGRVIALTAPDVGPGPFSIILDEPSLLETLSLDQPALADGRSLKVGAWRLSWETAARWDPYLPGPDLPLELSPDIAKILQTYTAGSTSGVTAPTMTAVASQVRQAATTLLEAIAAGPKKGHDRRLNEAVIRLAGMGNGLTPAGDDYLLGAMAALRLAGRPEALPDIAGAAAPRTTLLSAAFIRAAAQGQFMAPWHRLARVLSAGEARAVADAMELISRFGMSSGFDALQGFSSTLLRLCGSDIPANCSSSRYVL